MIVATFSKLRNISQTHDEIIVHGHQNAAGEFEEERFSKPEHRLHEEDNEYQILKE